MTASAIETSRSVYARIASRNISFAIAAMRPISTRAGRIETSASLIEFFEISTA